VAQERLVKVMLVETKALPVTLVAAAAVLVQLVLLVLVTILVAPAVLAFTQTSRVLPYKEGVGAVVVVITIQTAVQVAQVVVEPEIILVLMELL
jgi:hypothetical protein